MQEDKLKAAKKQIEIENKIAAFDSMQGKLQLMESQVEEASKVHGQLQGLLSQGALTLDDQGNLKPVPSQE